MGGKHSRASSQSLSQPSNLGSELTENRQKEVILCRLRHTYATHGHILRGEERPLCLRCYVPLAVAHVFFFVFSGYWRSRAKHLGRIATDVTLHDILGDVSLLISSGSLFSFSEQFDFL